MLLQFRYINHPLATQSPQFNPLTSSFTLTTTNPTDLYRTPPSRDIFNGPILATTVPLSKFKRARVTVSATWRTLYDQGGLIFLLPTTANRHAPFTPASASAPYPSWIKSGIEFYESSTFHSVVAANPFSDWSLAPCGEREITVEMERKGSNLWVYRVGPGGERVAVRELTWVFEDEEGKDVCVGCYTCKPKPGAEEGKLESLEVKFSGFEIEVSE
ncbi:hypothetical protein EJ05DRAFT_472557 [Pseudovirgaria hyperparasitica]|uniref:Uncharacterized protein n=1 Tax=Pseudovirgaria hyperparasitica TaxID=470096 RepID=A0A6A6WHV3_9PEZI|nr:uncharacterized protein EJ05DRAFT_472557 [Pseudovirgaria hyperparasitica]KAF2761576.1 hypothetical protein EJ05DRAFT_472557 [Pseudovirgaria hyperparasitica]